MLSTSVGLSTDLLLGHWIEIESCVRMMRSGGGILKAYIQSDLGLGLRYVAKSRHRPLALIQAIALPECALICVRTLCDDVRDSSARPDNLTNAVLGLKVSVP